MPVRPATSPLTSTPRLFWWILASSVVLALVPTVWTELDIGAAGVFIGSQVQLVAVHWWWVELINAWIPAVFRAILLVALLGWIVASVKPQAKAWRLPLAYIVLAGALGPGLLVNSGFKDNWQRARPYQVQAFGGTQQFSRATVMTNQCDNNCSFVSGHVACGFFWVGLLLVHRRRQTAWAVSGVLAGLVIGFARMADGAHWLSDVLWACPITLTCSWLVWKLLLTLYPPDRPVTAALA